MGRKTLNEPLHRALHKCSMKNSQILAMYKATTNQSLWACTYGIDCWMPATLVGRLTAKLVDRLTAMLVNRLTATLVNRLTAKLMNRLTAKLVVVNLVKLHLTKFKIF